MLGVDSTRQAPASREVVATYFCQFQCHPFLDLCSFFLNNFCFLSSHLLLQERQGLWFITAATGLVNNWRWEALGRNIK